jgi:hypothetical protein
LEEVGVRVIHPGILPIALVALVLAACSPTASSVTPAETEAAAAVPEALVGTYSVEYRTTESDHETVSDEAIVRDAEVTGSCNGSQCDLAFTTELKAPDGSTMNATTALDFDGTTYQGTQTASFSCDGMSTLTTVDGGLEYTSETTVTPTATTVADGRTVVVTFDIVTVERNEITAAGREAGCLNINFSGPDPYVTNATTVGVGTRKP